MSNRIFNKEQIYIDNISKTQEDAFKFIAKKAFEAGFVKSKEEFFSALVNREKEATTGFMNGIAIPHGKGETVNEAGLFLIKYENPIEWDSLDGEPTKVAFALTIPVGGADNHVKILSKIASSLIDDDFRENIVKEYEKENLYNLVAEIDFE